MLCKEICKQCVQRFEAGLPGGVVSRDGGYEELWEVDDDKYWDENGAIDCPKLSLEDITMEIEGWKGRKRMYLLSIKHVPNLCSFFLEQTLFHEATQSHAQ